MGRDLQARSVSDSQKIHNGTLGTGGFAVDLKFTSLVPDVLTIKGLFNDTSLNINPETGMLMIGSKIAISFHQSDLTIWDGIETLRKWKIEFTNGAGQDIVCEINPVMPDRSFGDVLIMCDIVSGHKP